MISIFTKYFFVSTVSQPDKKKSCFGGGIYFGLSTSLNNNISPIREDAPL